MTALNKQALREAAQEEIMLRSAGDTSDAWQDEASPEAVLALLDELEAAQKQATQQGNIAVELFDEVTRLQRSADDKAPELREQLEAAEKRIDELSASHSKLRDTIAAIHNTIRMDGGYTPLAAILNAAKRAHEESAIAAGIGVKGE